MYRGKKTNNNRTNRGKYQYQAINRSHQLSGYKIQSIDEYDEEDNFEIAINQHNGYIVKLKELIALTQKRISLLESAQSDKVFRTPSEYDGYLVSKEKNDEIEKRRQELRLKEQKKKEEEEKKMKMQEEIQRNNDNKVIEEISKRWNYVWRCARFLENDRICTYSCHNDITNDMTLQDCLNSEYIDDYLEAIKNIIREAHQVHNDTLVENDLTERDCPGECFCDRDCFAYANSHRTSGCGKKVYWETGNVDFLDGMTLDSTNPLGYLQRF